MNISCRSIFCAVLSLAALPAQADELTLRQALARTVENNPELAGYSAEIRAADARHLQSSLWPNPELEVAVENVAGSRDFQGTRSAETTIQLSQVVLLGGKHSAAIRSARIGREVAELDYAAKRLEVLGGAAQAFLDVLSAQEKVKLAEEIFRLSEQFAPAAKKRVEAGASSQVELTRFNLQIAAARVEKERARRDLTAARLHLAAYWGGGGESVDRVAGDLETLPVPASLEELSRRLAASPTLARWDRELVRRHSVIRAEKANGVPDLTVGAGYRHLSDSSDHAAVFSLSLPLPLFNRNQGTIREAQAELMKAEKERQGVETKLRTDLGAAYETLIASRTEIDQFKAAILPGSREAFDKVNEGYLAGRFGYLEVLDAQRTLLESRAQHLTALIQYHQAVVQIETLIGNSTSEGTHE